MDTFPAPVMGLVKLTDATTSNVLFHGANTVTKAALEVILRAVMETDGLNSVIAADTGLIPGADTTGLPNVVATALLAATPDLAPSQHLDDLNLISVGTVRARIDPPDAVTFDTLGLLSQTGLLVAAIALQPVTTVPGQPLLVEWTLALRGPGTYQASQA